MKLKYGMNPYQQFAEVDDNPSFKHVAPSGVAVDRSLSKTERKSYFIKLGFDLSPLGSAYALARGSDQLASFGDFIALNDKVDISTSKLIRSEVSDGIIAPGYDAKALDILKKKKILQSSIMTKEKGMEDTAIDDLCKGNV